MLDRRSLRAGSSNVTVLVVEDYEPFRQFLSVMLRNNPQVGIISEAGDGLAAVSRASEMKPDLVLLDIGLPKLSGIEAAKRIRRVSPESKLVFVSQESSIEVVREALAIGAYGYILKVDAGGELLAAVDAALQGKHFLGTRFAHQEFFDNTRVRSSPVALPQRLSDCRPHDVVFYTDPTRWADNLAQFVGSALQAGDATIVALTDSRRATLVQQLHARGISLAALSDQGRYISFDASDLLSTFMVGDLPDRERLRTVMSTLIKTAAKTTQEVHNSVVLCGECAPLLWSQGNAQAAIKLEHLWNEIAQLERVQIVCGYPLDSFQNGIGTEVFEQICAEHWAVHSHCGWPLSGLSKLF